MKYTILYCLFLLTVPRLSAQEFGGHPPSQKWRQINTDSVRVIFSPGLEKQAGEIVDITRALNRTTLPTIGSRTRKISIVLQHQTTLSNGYVGLGPWRSEFFLTPRQNSFELGSLPWYKSLALHEYRHVQQFDNFRKGISRVVYTIFGEQLLSLVNSAAVPNYFWEGDAVYQETMMSRQGRGRLPYFHNGYRSLWSADKNYSWQKLRNGSLRDYVPDHYPLGYMLVAYGRGKYGDSLWASITDDAVRFRKLFYPWQRSIKKHTGVSYPVFRNAALDLFKEQLLPSKTSDSLTEFAAGSKHFAGDERYPQWISANEILLVRSDYKNIPAFVIKNISTGKYQKIRAMDVTEDAYYSYKNNQIVYAAVIPDTRWGWRDYSGIRLVDIKTHKQHIITTRTKYFSPDISNDGQEIVAVHVDPSGESALHILKTDQPAIKFVIPNQGKLFYTYPKFSSDEQSIISAARNERGEMALVQIDRQDGKIENLTPWSMHVIGYPMIQGDTISFTASLQGVDQVMMLVNKQLYRINTKVHNSTTGNYQLSVYNGRYCWSAFSAVGYRLQISDSGLVNEISAVFGDVLPGYGAGLVTTNLADRVPKNNHVISKYHKSFHLLNPHSFRPYFNDPDFTFSLIGENVLNTFVSELYFNYNSNERSKAFGVNVNYGGLFPWIRGGVNYTFDRSVRLTGNRIFWNEAEANIGVSVPLNFSRGKFFRRLTISSDYVVNKRDFKGTYKDSFDNRSFGYLRSTLSFSNQVLQARQQIYPRLAQTLYLNYSRSVSSLEANQFLASAYLYFPGLFKTHSLVINGAFQSRDTLRNANFSNSFPFSRGYTAESYHHMFKLGVNYHFPLAYPDWGIASIIYFQRIRANLFYDFTRATDFNRAGKFVAGNFRSVGTEVFFDTKWWNQQPLSFGIRYSYLLDGNVKSQWGFILPIGI